MYARSASATYVGDSDTKSPQRLYKAIAPVKIPCRRVCFRRAHRVINSPSLDLLFFPRSPTHSPSISPSLINGSVKRRSPTRGGEAVCCNAGEIAFATPITYFATSVYYKTYGIFRNVKNTRPHTHRHTPHLPNRPRQFPSVGGVKRTSCTV